MADKSKWKTQKHGKRREGRWTPIRAKAQDTRANPNGWETHLVRKRWGIGLLRALSLWIMMKEIRTRNKWYNLKYYCQQSITNATFTVTLSGQSVQSVHKMRLVSRTLNRCSRALARSCLFCRTASVMICAGTRRKEVRKSSLAMRLTDLSLMFSNII